MTNENKDNTVQVTVHEENHELDRERDPSNFLLPTQMR